MRCFSYGPCAVFLVVGSLCAAQQLLPPPSGAGTGKDEPPAVLTITKSVDQVNLVFSVRDRRGRFVPDLEQGSFSVLDNKRPPQRVEFFQRQTGLPLRIGVLIDVSDSVSGQFKFEQAAAVEFLRATLRPEADRAFAAAFEGNFHLVHGLTSEADSLSAAIMGIKGSGATALYDALLRAFEEMGTEAAPGQRRAVIVLTDGIDNHSRASLKDVIETALRDEVVVYALSTVDDVNSNGELPLKQLTGGTGGRLLHGSNRRSLQKSFASLQEELRSQYLLAYTPSEFQHDGRYRSIRLKARGRGRLVVQARRGYYAPNDSAGNTER